MEREETQGIEIDEEEERTREGESAEDREGLKRGKKDAAKEKK